MVYCATDAAFVWFETDPGWPPALRSRPDAVPGPLASNDLRLPLFRRGDRMHAHRPQEDRADFRAPAGVAGRGSYDLIFEDPPQS
jgi:hypothetical protein